MSVSYAHLDVYKRQVVSFLKFRYTIGLVGNDSFDGNKQRFLYMSDPYVVNNSSLINRDGHPPRRGSCTCTGCWACSRPALPTARCCWRRTGGGCPSGTATRALKTCGQNTPRRRSSASWRMLTACSRSLRPAPRKVLCRTLRGRKSPSRISACPRGCFKKGNEKTTPASAKGAGRGQFFFLRLSAPAAAGCARGR